MLSLTPAEIGSFLKLFVRNGYVLNFKKNDFDIFTLECVGIPLCSKYNSSMGKSLQSFATAASPEEVIKLFRALLEYYEKYCMNEFESDSPYYVANLSDTYHKCREYLDRVLNISTPLTAGAAALQGKFSSEYLSKQINLMVKMQEENPTEAIGKAKELIESCCKTILDANNVKWDKKWDIGKLTSETMALLDLMPSSIPDSDPVFKNIKAVLGNLRGIPTKLAEIRNSYGSGHGKSASFTGLETRHAKLAVGCSITFVTFLWDTYEGGLFQ